MTAVENAINALDDGEVLTESLTSLGQRHQAWSVTEDHFAVNDQFKKFVPRGRSSEFKERGRVGEVN